MKKIVRIVSFVAVLAALLLPVGVFAQSKTFVVTVTNLTGSQIFSPPLVISHSRKTRLFEVGQTAPEPLYTLAEDGNPVPLADAMLATSEVFDAVAAPGPVMPGQTLELLVEVEHPYNFVSVIGMLVSTNDAFFSAQSLPVPRDGSHVTVNASAYDAGSEANNESCEFIPGPPCGNGGVRATAGAEGFIFVHSGIHGVGDLDPAAWDWRNPVARISVRRQR